MNTIWGRAQIKIFVYVPNMRQFKEFKPSVFLAKKVHFSALFLLWPWADGALLGCLDELTSSRYPFEICNFKLEKRPSPVLDGPRVTY